MGDLVTFAGGPYTDGAVYEGSNGVQYVYRNGCFLIPPPVDIDTVDGYSLQGISDGTLLDAQGQAIPVGTPVITFYDAQGQIINSKDCTEIDTFAILIEATSPGVDAAGNSYSAGDRLLQLQDGSLICAKKTIDTDTFASLIFASSAGIDDAGNAYVAGDPLLMLASGDIVCQAKTIDTDTVDGYAVQGVSDGTQLDLNGDPIPQGADIITFYDSEGVVINSKSLDFVESVTGNGVDNTDPKNPVVTAVLFVSGSGVDNTDPLNPVIGQSSFSQDSATGVITHTSADGTTVTAETKHSTTVPSADGTSHTITTDDGVATTVCVDQFKGFRQEGNSYIVQLLDQAGNIVDGDTITTVADTDQRLTNPVISQSTVDGVTTHTVTWDVVDIDGNVIGQESATGISIPVFVDKSGTPLVGPITVMQQSDFVASGEIDPVTDKIFGTRNGDCAEFDAPEQKDIVDGGSNFVADDGVTINPILDCNNEPIDVTTQTFITNADTGIYREIFLQNCPDDCVPPSKPKAGVAYKACDPTGKIWTVEADSDTWVERKRGYCKLPIVTDLNIAANFNVLNAANGDVQGTKTISFPNPTCDPVTYVVELASHFEGYINSASNGGASFFGIELEFDGVVVEHHTLGRGNTGLLYPDRSGIFLHRRELLVTVPPKTTVTKDYVIKSRIVGGYENSLTNVASALGSFASLRAVGQTDCDLN